MRARQIFPLATAFAAFVVSAHASGVDLNDAAGRYAISPAGSMLGFAIANVAGKGISGKFARYGGDIVIDGGNIAHSSVRITITPSSVATGQRRVDAFLKSDAVFDVDHERAITFRSSSVRRSGDRVATITGVLTARGHSNPATFRAELDGFGKSWISFHVTGKVLRSPYGMDVGTPIYSNVVQFDMELKARRQ